MKERSDQPERANKYEVALERRGSLFALFRMTLALLTPKERRRGLVVLGMVVMMALIETIGVASVMPFLAVLGNPKIIEDIAPLRWVYEGFGFRSTRSFMFALGIASVVSIVIASTFKTLTHFVMHRFSYMRRHSISERLLACYLRQPYDFFLGRNTSVLSKTVLSETDHMYTYVFKPWMNLVAYGATALVMIGLLIAVNPTIALMVGGVITGAYMLIYFGVRDVISRHGRDRVKANKARFKAAGEALGGIKDVKILGREEAYLQRFRRPSMQYSRLQASESVISEVPKNLIEAVGFGGIVTLTLVLMGVREDLGSVLSILGVYAFAAYRILPAAQHIYASVAKLRFGYAGVELLHSDFTNATQEPLRDATGPRIDVGSGVRFEKLSFRYPGSEPLALEEVDIDIPVNQTVGLIGRTGSGKTTAVDILLGLLTPSSGHVLVDGKPLAPEHQRLWRRSFGYVPQQIFLADTNVAENIAFGVPPAEIDQDAVERAAKAAQLHDFVVGDLPNGYATMVGERGIRLSGGQRQRIGIARALYLDPPILVLDEATSALDNATEEAVMQAINDLSGRKTIVMIAHRLTTVSRCSKVYVLERGKVKGCGPLAEVQSLVE